MLQLEMRPETKASRIKKFEEKEKEEQVRSMPGKHEARDFSHSKVRRGQLLQGPRMQRSAKRD